MSSNYTEELYDLEEIVEFFKFTASKLQYAINLLSLTFEPISYNLQKTLYNPQKTACFHVRSKLGQDLLSACSYSGFLCLKVLGLWILQTNLILFAGLTTCPAS